MTPRPRAVLLRATNINVLPALQSSTPAHMRFVRRQRQYRPLNARKIVVEHQGFATFILRTAPPRPVTPTPPAMKASANFPRAAQTPIDRC
jgi:hypothetical protein